MKLIDLLVQELPKRGGWPEGAESVVQDADDSEFYFFTGGPVKNGGKSWWLVDSDNRNDNSKWIFFEGKNDIADDCNSAIVTRDQYESALSASKKPAWNGEGVPPAGCECEFISNGTSWGKVKVIGLDGEKIVIRPSGEIYYAITPSNKDIFIPFRTEEEKKRDIVVGAIKELFKHGNNPRVDDATLIFNAISAGKIPGVKLDD